MTLGDLLVLYGVAGVASACLVYRKAERGRGAVLSAALSLPLWPLWLPVVLSGRRPAQGPTPHDATQGAIWEAHEAVLGSSLEPLLPRAAALRLIEQVQRAGQRHHELSALLQKGAFDPQAAAERVRSLEVSGTTARGLAPARLHLENVRRLAELRRRDEQTLLELGELSTALRTQLVLARYAGSAPVDAGDILNEVWARVEVLGSTLETPHAAASDSDHAGHEARTAG